MENENKVQVKDTEIDLEKHGRKIVGGCPDPLHTVDGVVYDGTCSIDPEEIEKMKTLKDAESASIYGS